MGVGDGVQGEAGAIDARRFDITPRPRSLLYAVIGVIVVESAAVHALIYKRWPLVSLALLVLNVWTLRYLVREFGAGSRVVVTRDHLNVRSGRALQAQFARSSVRSVRRPEWRDLPETGARGYLKIAGGDDPNVLLVLDPPSIATLPFGIKRHVATLGLRLLDPDAFISTFAAHSGVDSRQADVQR